jgi:hypothetical protein
MAFHSFIAAHDPFMMGVRRITRATERALFNVHDRHRVAM